MVQPSPGATPPYKTVSTYDIDIDSWSITTFDTRDDFKDFVTGLFKIPGEYEFDRCSWEFNKQARTFNKDGVYCIAPFRSKDFIAYWDEQKKRCRDGVIYKSSGKTWYLPREYYHWINFLPIYDKEEKKFDFPHVWDGQYHMALYELLAELNYKHSAILKKRQFGSSYYHMAKLINQYVFEEGAILKLGASMKDYINEKGSWKFLIEYHTFMNEHTAWYRPNEPDKVLSWQQKIKVRIGGRDTSRGTKAVITGMSFEKDPTNGVGGPVTYFFHEEAGIAPKMDTTFEYILPAVKAGMQATGMFIAAGSVGDLTQCEPLKKMILNPGIDIFTVYTNLIDKDGTYGPSGLFIPEQWSMKPCIDEFGNSLVEKALEMILAERLIWKKELSPEQYQLRISQKPINIEEAFAYRKESLFPQHLVSKQLQRIADGEFPAEYVDLHVGDSGRVESKKSKKLPISEFPVPPKLENKEGVVSIWEHPVRNAPWGTYFASIDPVSEGKTVSSDSLCSIIIYKNPLQRIKDHGEGDVENTIEHDKIVASWTGRFDNLQKTHERLELIIKYYNAWTLVENNISLFIQYMISKKLQKFLVPKDQVLFLKELGSNSNVFAEYGWKNTGTLFKSNLLSYGIEYLQEELDADLDENGEKKKVYFGVERIPDPMLLKEMQAYHPGLNVDRLVTYCSLIAFAKVQQSNLSLKKIVEKSPQTLQNQKDLYKLKVSAFTNIGRTLNQAKRSIQTSKTAFKNLR